jgi:hypothetical protein
MARKARLLTPQKNENPRKLQKKPSRWVQTKIWQILPVILTRIVLTLIMDTARGREEQRSQTRTQITMVELEQQINKLRSPREGLADLREFVGLLLDLL